MSRSTIFIIFVTLFLLFVMLTGKVYASTFKFSPLASRLTILAFLVLPLLFILGMLLSRGSRTISPTVYTLIQGLSGIGFFIFIGGILLSFIFALSIIFHFSIPLYIPKAIFLVSLGLAIVGLIQATFISVTKYTVAIKGLPKELEGKTAVLVSDTHIGLVNHKKFSNKVVNEILELRPDFVLHAGDFYDGPMVDTAPITKSWKRLADSIPVFYAPGNHEMYGNYGTFITSVRNAGVTVLDDKVVNFKGIQIAGLTYYGGENSPEAKRILENLPLRENAPILLINHPPTSLEAANIEGIDLMVSGHTHKGQFWPNTYLTRIIYRKYYYGLNDFKNMKVLTTSGVGTFGPPLRLFNTPELVQITFVRK